METAVYTKMEDNGLRPLNRYLTTHEANGVTGFHREIAESLEWQQLANGARFSLGYATNETPVDLNDDKDLGVYKSYLDDPPGITIPGGSVLRVVDMPPGSVSPMHRTVSLDYGVVLEGEVELILDSGATRLLRRGDIAVQRGTNHAWNNPSPSAWARMLFVLQEARPLRVHGVTLGEDYGVGMDDVKPSR
jgi:quercetin dioxygenase-like cupin family protein